MRSNLPKLVLCGKVLALCTLFSVSIRAFAQTSPGSCDSDVTPPMITCPPNVTAITSDLSPFNIGFPTVSDNCTADLDLTYSDQNEGCSIKRTWTATDAAGNFATCNQFIAISQISATLGQSTYVLYGALGYMGCTTLTPVVQGGVGPFTYLWTSNDPQVNGATTASVTPCNTTETTFTYTVTISTANGCVATATVSRTFVNISCSKTTNQTKIELCLRTGGLQNNCHTVCVSENAVQALVANGAYYGECLTNCEIPVYGRTVRTESAAPDLQSSVEFKVNVFNNPSRLDFTLAVNSNSDENISIRLVDATGKFLEKIEDVKTNQFVKMGAKYAAGLYFAEVIQGSSRKVVKLIKQ